MQVTMPLRCDYDTITMPLRFDYDYLSRFFGESCHQDSRMEGSVVYNVPLWQVHGDLGGMLVPVFYSVNGCVSVGSGSVSVGERAV